jgi:hypothetical protein
MTHNSGYASYIGSCVRPMGTHKDTAKGAMQGGAGREGASFGRIGKYHARDYQRAVSSLTFKRGHNGKPLVLVCKPA